MTVSESLQWFDTVWGATSDVGARAAIEVQRAALVDFDSSFFYHLVLFILLVLVLNNVIFKPLLRVEELRHQKTQGAIEQAEQAQIEAQKRVAEYEKAVTETRRRGNDDFVARREEAAKQGAAATEAARQASDAKLLAANNSLAERFELARKEIRVKARELSERIADKILGASQ